MKTHKDKTIDLEFALHDCVNSEIKTGKVPTLKEALDKELGKEEPEENVREWI